MIPVLIGGTGRSGTTVLKNVLGCHPQVATMPFELRLIVDPGGALDLLSALTDRWSPYNADIAIHRFRRLALACASASLVSRALARGLVMMGMSPWRYPQVGVGTVIGERTYRRRLQILIDDLTHHVTSGSWAGSYPYQMRSTIYESGPFEKGRIASMLAEFIHDLYRHIPDGSAKTHWAEDTPYNVVHAEELAELFPHMRLIHIYRDPRDVLASYRTKHWGGDDTEAIALRLKGVMGRWFAVRETLSPDSYYEVALERLAESPPAVLSELCDFAGLPYDGALEQIPLDRVNAGRWRQDLSEDDVDVVIPILQPFLDRLGYQ